MPDGGRVGTTQDRISDSRAEVSTVRASSQWAKQPNYRDCEAPSQIQAELLNWWVGVVWIELETGSSHLERNRISKQLQNPLRLQLRRPTAKGRAVVMSTTWAAARRSKPTPQRSNSPQGRKTTRALACWDTTERAGAAAAVRSRPRRARRSAPQPRRWLAPRTAAPPTRCPTAPGGMGVSAPYPPSPGGPFPLEAARAFVAASDRKEARARRRTGWRTGEKRAGGRKKTEGERR